MIYLILRGRLGNQLFMYAAARKLQIERNNDEIIIDDADVIESKWENLLTRYDLPNVRYIHVHDYITNKRWRYQKHCMTIFQNIIFKKKYMDKYRLEKKFSKLFQHFGYYECENGYLPCLIESNRDILMDGYFQSEKYFSGIERIIKNELNCCCSGYVSCNEIINKMKNHTVICLSMNIQNGLDNNIYSVCSSTYWNRAISYALSIANNPIILLCSDNVDLARKYLPKDKCQIVEQPQNVPANILLSLMSLADYYIIGNTTYAWWAQYLCEKTNKVVVAPSRWMNVEMPIDIYQEGWKLITV